MTEGRKFASFTPPVRWQERGYSTRRSEDPELQPFPVGTVVDWRAPNEDGFLGATDARNIAGWKAQYGDGPYVVVDAYLFEYEDGCLIHYVVIGSKKPLVEGGRKSAFSSTWFRRVEA